jgi:ornithine decarboxylase
VERVVFGPTCDSLDRLPGLVPLAGDLEEGDWLVWHGLGAYSTATVTRFNGYGEIEVVTTDRLT